MSTGWQCSANESPVSSCNTLLKSAMCENVTCLQEKKSFFLPESFSGEVDMRGVSCSSHREADHTENTEDGGCVRVFVCVGVSVHVGVMHNRGAQRATSTHQSHNHTLTTNRGRKRKTSQGYIRYSLRTTHTHTHSNDTWMSCLWRWQYLLC